MTARSSSTVRVRYAETDQMGIAYHGNYLAWMEIGRTDLLRERGMTYRQLEERSVRLPVLEAHVKYLKPALYDDVLEVLTTLEELGRARMRFAYEVRRVDDSAQLATGSTEHAAIGPDGRARRIPPELRELLG